MAIFYKHIKLMSTVGNLGEISFNDTDDSTNISFKKGNEDWGSFLLTNQKATIKGQMTFDANIIINNNKTINNLVSFSANAIKVNQAEYGSNYVKIPDLLTINSEQGLNCLTSIQGISFNATSDSRAKMNIKLANFNACEMIKHWPVYTFEYKNTSHMPMLGTMAQDMINDDINDFSFVNNKKATGYNDDYMSIKESKIVYVLLKAVQEQQEEIEELKRQIKNLQN